MSGINEAGFGTPSDDDNRPWLWVVSLVSCAYSVLTLGARILSKVEVLGWEDLLLGAAYVFGIGHWATFDRAVSVGFGARGETTDREAQLFVSSQTVLIIAHYFSKLSILLLARRLFAAATLRRERYFDGAIAIAAVFGVASVITLAAQCDLGDGQSDHVQRCKSSQARWTAVQVLDAVSELPAVALPAAFIWRANLVWSSKCTIISLFALRLPCIIFLAMAASEYNRTEQNTAADTSYQYQSAIWFEILLGYSLSSASFPCIRSFLIAFLSESKLLLHENTIRSHAQTERSGRSGTQSQSQSQASAAGHPGTSHSHEPIIGAARSIASGRSQGMTIGRDIEFEVLTEAQSRRSNAQGDAAHSSHDAYYYGRG